MILIEGCSRNLPSTVLYQAELPDKENNHNCSGSIVQQCNLDLANKVTLFFDYLAIRKKETANQTIKKSNNAHPHSFGVPMFCKCFPGVDSARGFRLPRVRDFFTSSNRVCINYS